MSWSPQWHEIGGVWCSWVRPRGSIGLWAIAPPGTGRDVPGTAHRTPPLFHRPYTALSLDLPSLGREKASDERFISTALTRDGKLCLRRPLVWTLEGIHHRLAKTVSERPPIFWFVGFSVRLLQTWITVCQNRETAPVKFKRMKMSGIIQSYIS